MGKHLNDIIRLQSVLNIKCEICLRQSGATPWKLLPLAVPSFTFVLNKWTPYPL